MRLFELSLHGAVPDMNATAASTAELYDMAHRIHIPNARVKPVLDLFVQNPNGSAGSVLNQRTMHVNDVSHIPHNASSGRDVSGAQQLNLLQRRR